MTESAYPQYFTSNGTPIRAYIAEAIGLVFDYDGGEQNFRGKHGTIGEYATAEDAIAAARHEKNETCTVRVLDTRADTDDGEHLVIFALA